MPSSELFNKAVSKVEQVIDSPSTTESLYKKYEALPLTQQLALSMTPGIGETISAYETPKFAGEAKESFDKGEYLEATGKTAMAGLSALGAIPFLGTGVRAVKGGIKAATKMDEIGEGLSSILKSEKELKKYGDTWKNNNRLPSNQRQAQDPIVKQAAQDLDSGKIKGKQFRDTVKEVLPIKPIDEMMDIPTFEEIAGALKKDQVKKGIVGVNKNIPDGTKVATRLDIPAYNNYDKWIVSIHEGIKGPSTGYSKSARLKNVNFGSSTKGALRVSKGADKATFARMEGNWTNTPDEDTISFAERLLKNEKNGKYIDDAGEEWVQVGMNPYRGSYFYDKATGQALQAADELIQVGPLVFAKGSRKPTLSEYKKGFTTTTEAGNKVAFKKGGQVMPMQYGGGLSDAYSTLSDRRRNQNMYGMGDAPMQQTPSQMSSAFQDPIEASAFSPVNMEHGGDIVVPKERMINDQPHQLSYINPQEAGLLKALGGSGRRVDGIPAYFMSDAEMDQADFDAGAFTGDTQGRGDAGENYATIDSQGNQTQAADIAADRANQEQFLAKGREIDDNRLINYATQIGRELDTYEDQKNNMLGDKTLKGFRNSVRNSLVNDLINAGVQDPDKVADQMMARSGSGFGDVASGSMTGEGGLSNFFYERGERFKDQLQSRIEELKKDDEVLDKDKGFFSSLKNMINNPLKDKIGKDPQIRDFLASQGVKDFRSFDQFSPTNLAIKGGLSLIPGVGTASTIGTLLSKLTGSEVVGTFSDPVTGKMMSLDTLGNTTFISPDSLTSGAADESGNDQIKEEVIKDPIDKPVVVEEDEKSAMSQLLAKRINNTSTIDPNVKIIMDVYGISQEEAQEFLGKKGVGTGSASEFEGI